MLKKFAVLLTASALSLSMTACGSKSSSSSAPDKTPASEADTNTIEEVTEVSSNDSATSAVQDTTAEPTTVHISPVEVMSASLGSQVSIDKVLPHTEGSNTLKVPLADLIEEGDKVSSFTFVIRSADGSNIGEFKGGCGISVNADCPAAQTEGWYQSPDFSAPTQGTYGEIRWDVPAEIKDYITGGGDVLFGYWWGNASSITVESVICTFERTREVPVDGTASKDVGTSVSYSANENIISVPLAGLIPEDAVPEAVTYNISSSGSFRKFNGAFGLRSGDEYYQSSPDTAIFTDSSSLSLTWFLPAAAKAYASSDASLTLGYWWSEQPSVTLDSVTVKYSVGGGHVAPPVPQELSEPDPAANSDFRSAAEIASAIKVGWNLGNTLDSYNTGQTGLATETGWGNPKTTKDMIQAVKAAGFNAVRIPVTWGEHMNGDSIDSGWLARVKEVVDYAYDQDLFVIVNMHHDDYIWFTPNNGEYAGDSAKLKAIWSQVAAQFKDYGDRLLFEGMNEPRTVGSPNEWMGGTSEERAVVTQYEQDFISTVRATGGNNSARTLVVTSYAASAETAAINDVSIPADAGNIILSLHYYAPWKFSEGTETSFDESGKTELMNKFTELHNKFVVKGIPVIIGEFGCINAATAAIRSEYYRYYISAALSQGIKCFIWDNGVTSGSGSYGIFNRSALSWDQDVLNGIMTGAAS